MATITEDYCSFEVAKLLKEKRFDEPCHHYYSNKALKFSPSLSGKNSYQSEDVCSAPTHQMTKKWLREVHKIFIEVYAERAYNYNDIIFNLEIWDRNLNLIWKDGSFTTYEQACEAALKYSLENLIK